MNVLILGDRARFDRYMPEYVPSLPLTVRDLPAGTGVEAIVAAAPDTEILLADAGTAAVPARLISALPGLKLIHTDGAGFNGVDLTAARQRGIPVCNCAGCNADAVAETAVMLMLMLARQAIPGRRAVLEGRQIRYKEDYMRASAPEFADLSVGLVGLGAIGRATARRLAPFGNRLYYFSPRRRDPWEERELNLTYLPLEELAAACDIFSLHCPVTAETEGMVNGALLSRMKPGALLINTARGQLVDNGALRQALLSGQLGGAGFDTLWPEPTPADHPLVDLPDEVRDRVAYLPHLGGNTGPAFRRAYATLWDNVRRVLEGQPPINTVN